MWMVGMMWVSMAVAADTDDDTSVRPEGTAVGVGVGLGGGSVASAGARVRAETGLSVEVVLGGGVRHSVDTQLFAGSPYEIRTRRRQAALGLTARGPVLSRGRQDVLLTAGCDGGLSHEKRSDPGALGGDEVTLTSQRLFGRVRAGVAVDHWLSPNVSLTGGLEAVVFEAGRTSFVDSDLEPMSDRAGGFTPLGSLALFGYW